MSIATRDDVVACYRTILGREPENDDVVSQHIGSDLWAVVHRFSHSDEHRANVARHAWCSIQKFGRSRYLAQSLSVETRASALIHNYAELRRIMRAAPLVDLLQRSLLVVGGLPNCADLSVTAGLAQGVVDEGEISLTAALSHERLAVLSFTIVDGADFGLNAGSALLVSRLQGHRGVAEGTKRASQALGDISMPHVLVAALEGIAAALGIRTLLGVEARSHPSFDEKSSSCFVRAYDDFFVSLGASQLPSGFFHLALPRVDRPIDGSGHRSRRRLRRNARRSIKEQAQRQWATYMREPAGVPVAPRPAAGLLTTIRRTWRSAAGS